MQWAHRLMPVRTLADVEDHHRISQRWQIQHDGFAGVVMFCVINILRDMSIGPF